MHRLPQALSAFLIFVSACHAAAPAPQNTASKPTRDAAAPTGKSRDFGVAPKAVSGPLSDAAKAAVETILGGRLSASEWGKDRDRALMTIAASGDARLGWIISDLLRMVRDHRVVVGLRKAAGTLLGIDEDDRRWMSITNRLMAWDIPAPPGYLDFKRRIFVTVEPRWAKLFVEGNVDWRMVTWGGVLMDDRPYNRTDEPCDCIPAADNPTVSNVDAAGWLDDRAVVFGIEVNGLFRAYPRRIMEVREMINDQLGGRRLGIPYCTLCGSAQAYLTDKLPDGVAPVLLRTSGMLSRSNKLMFDRTTYSVFDTFLGTALTGPLAKRGVKLEQVGVVTTTWGAWRKAHPDTTVLVEELALGRDFDFRNNRDANGPIFPIGNNDPRLALQEDVLGVIAESGVPIAFHVPSALTTLRRGDSVQFENIHLSLSAGGVRAVDTEGRDLRGHQAFWFAWSQFYPDTKLWPKPTR